MKAIKIEIKSYLGTVLFSYESEDNTTKKTLEKAVKERADLRGAYLGGAYLGGADLRGACLGGAYLRGADLRGAYLRGACLGGADLRGADLRGAYLGGAYLGGAYLGGADLRGADLGGADLRGADLGGADLRDAENVPYIPFACPSDGAFIAWKKLRDGKVAKLLIPEDARRCSATGTKCRADKAQVIDIFDMNDESKHFEEGFSDYDQNFRYRVFEMVTPDEFDEDRWNECSRGIHFFINKQEAINYE